MIKFFRKIRQDLLSKGKTGKYFKYAIGEIVLVVIGILIALSINNWNENKNKQQKIDEILRQVNLELEYNIKQVEKSIELYIIKDSLAHRMLNVTLKTGKFDSKHDRRQINIMFSSNKFIPETESFESLIQNSKDIEPVLEPIIRDLKKINIKLLNNIINSSEKMRNISDTYRTHLVYNSDWFSSFYNGGQINQEGINHILKDPVFKNNLVWYRTAMTSNYNRDLRRYAHKARIIHQSIKEVLGDTSSYDFEYKHQPLELIQNLEGTYVSNEHGRKIQFEIFLKDGTPFLKVGKILNEIFFTNNNTFHFNYNKLQILNDGSIFKRLSGNGQFQIRTFEKIDGSLKIK